jgi:hypothetical protein
MGITLIVDADTAAQLHDRDPRNPLITAIRDAGGEIFSMPAFAPDEPGARTFTVEADDPHDLVETLRGLPGVEACYVKPEDHLP